MFANLYCRICKIRLYMFLLQFSTVNFKTSNKEIPLDFPEFRCIPIQQVRKSVKGL